MTIDWTKPVWTREDHWPARVVVTDMLGKYPIGAVITLRDAVDSFYRYTRDGRASVTTQTRLDLVNVPEKVVLHGYAIVDETPGREPRIVWTESEKVATVPSPYCRRIPFTIEYER